jgi:N-acetylglucosamine kinase-like BadF-type ATPase
MLLAVDGGNWKTHVALARADGAVLALARGPESSPHLLGEDGSLAVIESLLARARADAREDGGLDVAYVMLAGADLPEEERRLQDAVAGRAWARRTRVANDTFAVLRAGTDRGWGVAVVCGAGINCVGVAPDGRVARWPALGAITGDWGGGHDVGLAALSAAARAEDGRGPRTALADVVARHFGLASAAEVGQAIHQRRIAGRRLVELAPLVLGLAAEDAVAAAIAGRLADEVVAFARTAIERLGLDSEAVDVVLGGGLLRAEHGGLVAAVQRGLETVAPRAAIRLSPDPPIVGAALLALDDLGAPAGARARLRAELRGAVQAEEAARAAAGAGADGHGDANAAGPAADALAAGADGPVPPEPTLGAAAAAGRAAGGAAGAGGGRGAGGRDG